MASRFEKRLRAASLPDVISRYFSNSVFVDALPQATLTAFQIEALQEVVKRAYENSPFYKRKMSQAGISPRDITAPADLAKLPFTTKEELRQDPWALLACDKREISLIHVSTGTTGGQEIYTMHSWRDYYLNHAIAYPKLIPVDPSDMCFIALPYEMSSAGLSFHNKFIIGHQAAVVPVGKGGAYSTPEKTIRLMRNLKPTVVVTSPSHAITLAEAAAAASFDLASLALKKIWLGGEGCSDAFRRRVEKIWGTTANFSFGSTECGALGNECDAHNGYHLMQGHVLVEIIDPVNGNTLPPGETGEIVVTCLLRFDTPLLRYRTGDLGCFDPEPCHCGLSLQRLQLRGRKSDQITINGKVYSPFYLEEFLMRLPEAGNWYQFVVKPGNNEYLKIRTELAPGLQPSVRLAAELAVRMEAASGVPCEIEFVAHLPRQLTKATRVVYE